MPPALPEPTRRTNILLFAADCAQLERRYGRGWTEQIRLMVRANCKAYTDHQRDINAAVLGLESHDGN